MNWRPHAIGAVAGAAIAVAVCWWLWHPTTVREGPAFEQKLPSGGVIVRRDPAAPVPAPTKRAAKEAGGKLERSISVTIQPQAVQAGVDKAGQVVAVPTPQSSEGVGSNPTTGNRPPADCSCKPITVDLGLIRMPDRTRRVVATAEGGTILDSIDIPIDAAVSKRETRWAAGVAFAPFPDEQGRKYGAWVDRDVGPLRLGAEVQFAPGFSHPAAWARAGVRF